MRVKVGNRWYSSKDQPIMVELSKDDKRNISNMAPDSRLYAEAEDNISDEEFSKWMREV
jgi:hypothetical protein